MKDNFEELPGELQKILLKRAVSFLHWFVGLSIIKMKELGLQKSTFYKLAASLRK